MLIKGGDILFHKIRTIREQQDYSHSCERLSNFSRVMFQYYVTKDVTIL